MRRLILFLAATLPFLSFAESGWSVGVISVGSENFESDAESRLFFPPTIHSNNRDFLFLPNIQYDWEQWAVGITGITWRSKEVENKPRTTVKLGYPFNYIDLYGGSGFKRYGARIGTEINDGVAALFSLTAGPFDYALTKGVGDRDEQFGQSIKASAPVYFDDGSPKVFASVSYTQNNADLQAHKLGVANSLQDSSYQFPTIGLFGFTDITENLSLVQSFEIVINDADLKDELDELGDVSFSYLTVITYKFGKH